MKTKVLYVGMKYDYGDKARGLSFEHRNFYHSLNSYSKKQNWDFVHYDFMERGLELGLDLMTQELYELAKKEKPAYLFAVLFDFHRDPRHEVFKQISSLGIITIHWFCDDHWRFEKYSSVVAPHFDFVCTTARSALPKYEKLGMSPKVIKTQWACNHELYVPYNIEKDVDISFVGQPHGNRVEILSKLVEGGLALEVFGFGWKNRPRIPFYQMVRLFSRSKINLNLSNSSTLIGQQIKGRNFEIPGTRSFLLTSNAENLSEYYEDGKEVVLFETPDELSDKVAYYLINENERRRIAENGYKRTLNEHTWCHRFDTIFSFVSKKQHYLFTLNTPLVSVIIPCYNQANFLPEAVESVVHQTFTRWECIIVNDGSNDNTNTVAEKLVHKFSDKQISVVTQVNQGLSCARNSGIKISRGKYILPLDADDLIHLEMLQKTVSLLESNPETAIAYTDVRHFGNIGRIVCSGEYDFQRLCRENYLSYCSLYRRAAWEAVGGYNSNMIWGYEDWDFWVGCGGKGFYGKRIPEPLFLYRVKDASMYTNALRHHSELVSQIVLNHQNLYNANTVAEAKGIVESCSYRRQNNLPVVSVIVPTYNRPDFLTKALESIAAQTYKNCEIIVVNDAGRDVSAVVNSFQGRLAIIYLVHTENKGLAASRNTGISAATGKYIAYLDDDDVYYPDHIETLVGFLENNDYKVAYTDAYRAYQEKENEEYVTKKREVSYSYDFEYDYILVNNFVPVLCIMHGKECLYETGLFDESLMSLEDMDCWIRMSRKYKFAHIKRVTCEFTWREDGTSITSGQKPEFLKAMQIIYHKYREYALNKPHVLKAQEELLCDLKYATTSRKNTFKHNQIFREIRQKCTVIIPVFNKVEFTRRCIESIRSNTPQQLFDIIIIDNASTDNTKNFLKSLEGGIRVITNEKNLGFARACNQGAQITSADYLLFLNNDTEPKKGWLEPLLNIITQDYSVGAVGSKLLFPDGTIQHAGLAIFDDHKLPDPLVARHIYYGQPMDIDEANQLRQYQALTAACLLVHKSAFNEVGGFDESYWNGYEDVDLCFKLQEKGWKLVYQPESVVIHHESKSGTERFSRVSENIQRLHNKWIGKIQPDMIIEENGSMVVVEGHKIQRYSLPHTGDKKQLKPVSIIMLTWNALEYTKKCVNSIQHHASYPHEIIFVDNASTDGTVEYLRNLVKEHSNDKLIENKENSGFAAGNNQGVAAASGEYVLLLNNDVLVSDGWLESLVKSLGCDEKIGMVGPITSSISGRQMVNSVPYTDDAGFHVFSQKIRKACCGRLTPRYRIAGFAALMKKSLYEEVGGLDESFGTGNYEDDDLCLKIRAKGYAVMVDESVFIHHYRSQTFIENKIDYRSSLSVNESKFMKKWPDVDYKLLLELDKSLVDINADLISQGQKAVESENADEAIKVYSKVLSTNPIDEAALCGIGMAYQMDGKTDSAIDAYKKVIKKYTNFSRQPPPGGNSYLLDAYRNLALLYAGTNQIDDAIFMLKKAIELSSSDATLYNNLGVLYFKKKMCTEAAQCFSDALSIDARYGEAKKNLERVLISYK